MDSEIKVCKFLNIPSIPKKKWNGESSFSKGVALVKFITNEEDYVVCSYDNENDNSVRIIKSFVGIPFTQILDVYPIPSYMEDDINEMTLDEESKEAVEQLLQEKEALVNEGIELPKIEEYEWGFPFIKDEKEAIAYLKANVKGKLPIKTEAIKMRLVKLYHDEQKKKLNK